MNQILSILFYFKSSKKDKNGFVPIYLRITLNGRRAELSTHRKIHPLNWDNKACQAKGASEEARTLNNYLDNMKAKVYRQFNILESLGNPFSATDLKNRVIGNKIKHHSLIEVFNYHNDQLKQKIGVNYAKGTHKRYKSTLSRLKSFLLYQYRKSDILLSDLKYSFVTNFELYLKTQHSCGQNTTMKHIVRLKKIVNLAVKNEWLDKDPFRNYKATYVEVNRGYLTKEELTRLEEKEFKIPRLEKVMDVFIFCCYTGFSYADVKELTPGDITNGIDGEKWIITYRRKTNHRSPVPMLLKALEIIEKYKDYPENAAVGKLLPISSNQHMNGYLKEIADICEITKNLTMHLARHTFATTVTLANGVPIETVSKMLGHTSIKTTQIYSKVVDSKISDDMKALKGKLIPAKEKVAI